MLGRDGLPLGRFFPLDLKIIAYIEAFQLDLLCVSILHHSCIAVASRLRGRAQVLLRRALVGPFADTADLARVWPESLLAFSHAVRVAIALTEDHARAAPVGGLFGNRVAILCLSVVGTRDARRGYARVDFVATSYAHLLRGPIHRLLKHQAAAPWVQVCLCIS